MSAFVVDDETIHKIVSGIEHSLLWSHAEYPQGPDGIELPPQEGEQWEALKRLGARLRSMNESAVMHRYREKDRTNLPGPCPYQPYKHAAFGRPDPVLLVKALQCYLYQCAEGDVPEKLLYKLLREWEGSICRFIVHQLPAYDALPWE